jgi:hypothetical protein
VLASHAKLPPVRFGRLIPVLAAPLAVIGCATPPPGSPPVQVPPPVTSVSGDAAVRITKISTSVVGGAETTTVDGTVTSTAPTWRTYVVTLRPSAGLLSSVTVNSLAPGQTGVWQDRFPGRVTAGVAAISATATRPGPALTPGTVRLTTSIVSAPCLSGPCTTRQVTGTMFNPDSVQHQIIIVDFLASDGSTATGGVYNLAPGQTANWKAAFDSNVDAAQLSVVALRIEAFM